MQDISVQVEGEKVIVTAPFNRDFAHLSDGMGGRWDSVRGFFTFPVAVEPHIRALAWSVYMTDGTSPLGTFHLDCSPYAAEKQIIIAGRIIVERWKTSRRPRLSPGVFQISGDWSWPEGVQAYQATLAANDVILQLVLPESISHHEIAGLVPVPTIGNHEALISEWTSLSARLAVVNSELEAA